MKRNAVICFALLLSLFVMSCTNDAEKSIKKMERIVERVEGNYKTYTVEDWENVFEEIGEVTEEFADVDFSEKQLEKITRLNAKVSELCTEQVISNFGTVFSGVMKGLVNGFKNVIEELEEAVDELEEQW